MQTVDQMGRRYIRERSGKRQLASGRPEADFHGNDAICLDVTPGLWTCGKLDRSIFSEGERE